MQTTVSYIFIKARLRAGFIWKYNSVWQTYAPRCKLQPPLKVLVFERAQFLLLSDFPHNIDTCQRKQTWSARLIGKNSAESHFVKLATDLSSVMWCVVKFVALWFLSSKYIHWGERMCKKQMVRSEWIRGPSEQCIRAPPSVLLLISCSSDGYSHTPEGRTVL